MIEDRDRWDHSDNIEEIVAILRIRGWGYLIGYLQSIADNQGHHPKMRKALDDAYEVAELADDYVSNGLEEPAPAPAKRASDSVGSDVPMTDQARFGSRKLVGNYSACSPRWLRAAKGAAESSLEWVV